MACAVYSREIIFLTVISHIANQYKSIKSIDDNLYKKIIDTKSKTDLILLLLKHRGKL